MKRKNLFPIVTIISLLALSLMYSSCTHEPELYIENTPVISTNCDEDTVYFQNEVLPLLVSSCATTDCHNAIDAEDGIVLIDYASVIKFGGINLEQPEESEIYEVLVDEDEDDRMPPPPNSGLSSQQKNTILNWIKQGAINNECAESECDTTNVGFSASVWPVLETNCVGCHSGADAGGQVQITNYSEVVTLVENGRLMGAIKHMEPFVPMPKDGNKLSDCDIAKFDIWIQNGTKND